MGVDQYWRLYYNPEYIKDMPVEELSTVLYHELNHILRDHHGRAEKYDRYLVMAYGSKWGISTDLEINDDIDNEGLQLPKGCIRPKTWQPKALPENKMAEEYMNMLPDPEFIEIEIGVGAGDCGSGADGEKREYELGEPTEKSPGVRKGEGDLIRRDVAQKAIEHAAKEIGSVPANFLRWAKKIVKSEVDWRKELSAVIKSSIAEVRGFNDFTFRRPARRQPFPEIKLPSMVSPIPKVAIQTDTSGSISDAMLATNLAEVDGILRTIGYRDDVVHFSVDAAVGKVRKVHRASQIKFEGGGGTDMGVGIEFAKTLRPRIDILVIITDGYTPWPDVPPPYRTVVVLLADGTSPSWARTIRVKPPEAE